MPHTSSPATQAKVSLSTLLDSHKILPHYERVSAGIFTGGGEQYKLSAAYRGGIPLVRKL